MNRISLFAAALAGVLCAAGAAWSQPYPSKPVRVIVPFPPGGANDIVARIALPKVSEQMGQQFIIENRSGAGGTIGSTFVAQSKPDGYTLLIQTVASHASNAHLYNKLPYDPLRDFVGVSPIARVVSVLTVHPSLPTRSVKEFIALAKKRPGEILHGHSGQGSFTHMNGVMFESRAGIRMVQVPFKGGGPAVIALVSGETQAQVAAIGELIAHIKVNRVRALGVTAPERIAQLPDVPPIADTIPGYESATWVSVFAPSATPKPILDRLNAELGKALKDADTASKLSAQTLDPAHRSPEELTQRLRADHETIGKLFREAGVKPN
ncbi:MAG: tripartite tricarboxylate transporter substrate binding protein [Betaproteobacteria bacterium]|nr:tripartite tricarboxylate transporter substrate binding protein [Betaproteobacteria bacterium]